MLLHQSLITIWLFPKNLMMQVTDNKMKKLLFSLIAIIIIAPLAFILTYFWLAMDLQTSDFIKVAKPSSWFKGSEDRDINFYLGSATYISSGEGGAWGEIYLGSYWTSNTLGTSPSDTGDLAYKGKPEGKMFALWKTHTRVEDWSTTEQHFYYAALPKGQVVIAPPRKKMHWYYKVYAFMGHKFVYDEGVTQDEKEAATTQSFTLSGGRGMGYRVGEAPALYYLVESFAGEKKHKDQRYPWAIKNQWLKINAIEITEAQFRYMRCTIHLPDCTPFLTENTPGLTSEQLAYVKD